MPASRYAKAIVAAVMAALVTAAQYWPDNRWIVIVISFLTVIAVYVTPNK